MLKSFYVGILKISIGVWLLGLAPSSKVDRVKVGAYIWGGNLSTSQGINGFYDSVDFALKQGFSTIRFKIGPGQIADYSLNSDSCAQKPTLGCYATQFFASEVWNNPKLKQVMITAHDFTLYEAANRSNSGYFDHSILEKNHEKAVAEYYDLIKSFSIRFRGRNVRLIISNWEGDNLVYCGSAFKFSQNANGFAARCLSGLQDKSSYPNINRLQGLLEWFSIKDEAVKSFTVKDRLIDVVHAPEFNNVDLFKDFCSGFCNPETDTLLHQIAKSGGREYCSYSIYDIQTKLPADYLRLISTILKICRKLIIGEAGFDSEVVSNRVIVANFQLLAEVARMKQILAVIPWHFIDQESSTAKFGLFGSKREPRQIELMGPLRPEKTAGQSDHTPWNDF